MQKSKYLFIAFVHLCLVGGCTYDSDTLNTYRCDVPNQVDDDRICKDGIWQQRADLPLDLGKDISPDLSDMTIPDMKVPVDMGKDMKIPVDMGKDMMKDMADPDMAPDMVPDMCTPLPDATLCGRSGFQCDSATVTDNCGTQKTIDCGTCTDANATCTANKCDVCADANLSDNELCKTMMLCGEPTIMQCGKPRMLKCMDTCGVDMVCGANFTCECAPVVCAPDDCGVIKSSCQNTDCGTSQCNTNTANACDLTNNRCVCEPSACPADMQCGQFTNSCGAVTNCGVNNTAQCAAGQFCVGSRCGQTVNTQGASNDLARFGYAVAIDGERMVVGEPFWEDPSISNAVTGRVLLYIKNAQGEWTFNKVFKPGRADAAGSRFGWSVDIDGESFVIGAPFLDTTPNMSGRAHGFVTAFVLNNNGDWNQRIITPNSSVSSGDRFGFHVELRGSTVYASSPSYDEGMVNNVGRVFEFTCNAQLLGCSEKQINLPTADINGTMWFGSRFDVKQDSILVGAPLADNDSRDGAAYFFKKTSGTWVRQHRFELADTDVAGPMMSPPDEISFGTGVALDGTNAFISAPFYDDLAGRDDPTLAFDNSTLPNRYNAGVTYLLDLSQLTPSASSRVTVGPNSSGPAGIGTPVANPVSQVADGFGYAIKIKGDLMVIGAFDYDFGTGANRVVDAGNVSVWRKDAQGNWNFLQTIVLPNASEKDFFGAAVDTDGTHVVVGAFGRGQNKNGEVFVFEF